MYFNENGELKAGFDIINWVTFRNQSFLKVNVGRMNPHSVLDQVFTINKEAITWHMAFNQVGSKQSKLGESTQHFSGIMWNKQQQEEKTEIYKWIM